MVCSFDETTLSTWNLQLYDFIAAANTFVPNQDPFIVYEDVLSIELSRNEFVYWDRFQQGAVIDLRQNGSGPYSFVEQLYANAPLENQIALHNDVLIVGGNNQTHIFKLWITIWIS